MPQLDPRTSAKPHLPLQRLDEGEADASHDRIARTADSRLLRGGVDDYAVLPQRPPARGVDGHVGATMGVEEVHRPRRVQQALLTRQEGDVDDVARERVPIGPLANQIRRSECPVVLRIQGRGVASTLGGSGDGSGCVERLMMENDTAPTARTATPTPITTAGLGRRLVRRAFFNASGRLVTAS